MKRQRRRLSFVHVDRATFYLERRTAGMSQKETAAFLGVTVRTLRNWENGTNRIPYPAFKLIRMRAGGIVHAPGWDGWRFGCDGALFAPDGRSFKSWELYHLRHVFSMAEHFRNLHRGSGGSGGAQAEQAPPPRLRLLGVAS
jgi:transcriptional regulator with XRE-family HTH domain